MSRDETFERDLHNRYLRSAHVTLEKLRTNVRPKDIRPHHQPSRPHSNLQHRLIYSLNKSKHGEHDIVKERYLDL